MHSELCCKLVGFCLLHKVWHNDKLNVRVHIRMQTNVDIIWGFLLGSKPSLHVTQLWVSLATANIDISAEAACL